MHYIPKTIFIILLLINVKQNFAQQKIINTLIRTTVKTYDQPYPELRQLKIPTNYSEFVFEEIFKGINFFDIDILAWDLVFTRHPIGVNHSQLNENRLQWFSKRLPIAFKIPNKYIRIVEQTAAKTKPEAAKLFHGFAIYYRKKLKPGIADEEIKYMDSIIEGKPIKISIETPTNNATLKLPTLNTTGKLTPKEASFFNKDEVNFTYICNTKTWYAAFKKYYDSVEVVSLNQLMNRSMLYNRNSYQHCDSILIGYKYATKSKVIKFEDDGLVDDTLTKIKLLNKINTPLIDSTVLKALNRNNWNASVICTDVTGSMSPFSTQLLLWIKNKIKEDTASVFYFFNDGNMKRDAEKIIGSTGGIYKIKSANYNQIVKTLKTAMRNGFGGDYPENNIECLLLAQNENPNAKEIIMLADNWVQVRDIELLPQIKVPIRIVLCGNRRFLNEDYLTIAYKTKGSVHTATKDFVDLYKLKENDTIEYNNTTFKLLKGSFVFVPRKD